MGKLFGTDGVRGIANKEPITPDMAVQIGQAVTYLLRKEGKEGHRPRIVIGKDTRLSGYMLENALVTGITSMGGDVVLFGPIPTPGIAFLTDNVNADAGIMISASHNPFEDNGIKIFSRDGFKLTDEEESRIEDLIFSKKLPALLVPSKDLGRAYREEDATGRYIVFLKHSFPKDADLEGMKIVIDCANGATYKVAPMLLKEMRAEVTALNVSPNGRNINLNCGALHPEELSKKVLETGADIGIAFDGDGDRFIAVDEKGAIVNGDKIIAICAKSMKAAGILKNNCVVTTVMSNLGLSVALKEMGIKHLVTKVGDRYVLEEMLKCDSVIGGEDSGHIIFRDHHSTGDGILTALQLLSIMLKEGRPLSELAKVMQTFPQVTINIEVKKKQPLDEISEVKNAISEIENKLGGKGRVLVRYSGTQLLCRVMVEGPTLNDTKSFAQKIAAVIKGKLA
ncbi:MAG: Phosphoglucosamine mutase [Elusimicrobia bacterium ADurb.Bin231]|nr:MAG: Phosphoglucosamine mutase [Elusimicrobia bacterium ADurb.Bin231]